jgi:hypothetical protein
MKLLAKTSVGQFSRTTNSNYKYVVVRNSERAKESFDKYQITKSLPSLSTDRRWIKDNGFAVTWHGSLQSAEKSALGFYSWDKNTTLVGIFKVEEN